MPELVLVLNEKKSFLPILQNILTKLKLNAQLVYLSDFVSNFKSERELKGVSSKVWEAIVKLQPKLVITYGEAPLFCLTGRKVIKDVFLQPLDKEGIIILPSYDPSYLLNTNFYKFYIEAGLRKAYSMLSGDGFKLPPIEVLYDEEDFRRASEILKDKVVGLDFETTGVNIFASDFTLISAALALEDRVFFVKFDSSLRLIKMFEELLRNSVKKVIVHNFLFDGLILKYVLGISSIDFEDTLILSYLVDENFNHTLKSLASVYLNIEYAFTIKKLKKQGKTLSDLQDDELSHYNSLDAYCTLKLYDLLYNELALPQRRLYSLLKQRFVPVLMDLISNGFPVDLEYITNLKEKLQAKEEEVKRTLNSLPSLKPAKRLAFLIEKSSRKTEFLETGELPQDVRGIVGDEEIDLEPTKTTHILAVLKTLNCLPTKKTKSGRFLLQEEVLKDIDKEEIKLILEFRKLRKINSTYIENLLKHITPDGRIHSSYSLTSTATGRLASSNPNLQNIPTIKEIKDMFCAPSGYVLLQYDWSQIELRVAAALSGDLGMIKLFQGSYDFHKVNASKIFKKRVEDVTEEERKIAKSVSFGILYGISPEGLAENCNLSIEEAKKMIEEFYKAYPILKSWQDKIVSQVTKSGVVVSPLGRMRRLPSAVGDNGYSRDRKEALRQAINFPVQATASDLNVLFLSMLKEGLPKENLSGDVFLIGSVHDSGIFLVRESQIENFLKYLERSLKNFYDRVKSWLREVPLEIKVSIGKRWGSLEEGVSLNAK